jgi:hypothetical protein
MLVAGTRLPIWLALVYILSLCAVIAWPFVAITSPMAFDDPASHRTAAPYIYVACAVLYPILPVGGVAGSFVARRRGHRKVAYALAAVALAPTAIYALWAVLFLVQVCASILGSLA